MDPARRLAGAETLPAYPPAMASLPRDPVAVRATDPRRRVWRGRGTPRPTADPGEVDRGRLGRIAVQSGLVARPARPRPVRPPRRDAPRRVEGGRRPDRRGAQGADG